VWLDKADALHVTTGDPDVPGNGIHMRVKRGSQTDRNLRQMLTNLGATGSGPPEDVTDPPEPEESDSD
jgi:hypothetical protein